MGEIRNESAKHTREKNRNHIYKQKVKGSTSEILTPHLSLYCQNISLYEPEQSLSLSQDEGEQCWGVP